MSTSRFLRHFSSAPGRVQLEFFYDVLSPYSWMAYEVLSRYKPHWNFDMKMRPIFLAAIMNETGNRPPGLVPNKGLYISKDLERLGKYFSVPFRMPDNIFDLIMNKGTLQAQRFITAVDMINPEFTEAVSKELWMRIFNKHKDVSLPDSFREVGKTCGMDSKTTEEAISDMNNEKVKDRLKEITHRALEHGAFGVPTIVVDVNGQSEMFFGCDRLELMGHAIGGHWYGPFPKEQEKSNI